MNFQIISKWQLDCMVSQSHGTSDLYSKENNQLWLVSVLCSTFLSHTYLPTCEYFQHFKAW
jgi:hypothetical protein